MKAATHLRDANFGAAFRQRAGTHNQFLASQIIANQFVPTGISTYKIGSLEQVSWYPDELQRSFHL